MAPGSITTVGPPLRVGLHGTGFIARGLLRALAFAPDFTIASVLTHRPVGQVEDVDSRLLTHDPEHLVDSCEVVVDCSGDVLRTAEVTKLAHLAGRPVVTMGTEFHVTVGSCFCESGYLTEAEGDQPGTLAALAEDAAAMGFRPRVYGNIKGFLNHHPLPDEMAYWAARNGIRPCQTVSFTDGTKLQMEQALVANGLGATLAQRGMLGPTASDLVIAGAELGRRARELGKVLCDYLLGPRLPPGVFLVAEHPYEPPDVLRYLKLGDGPDYVLVRPHHLCHLEMLKTLRRLAAGAPPQLNNSPRPTVGIAAVAKRRLEPGEAIERAVGGYQLRGEAVVLAEAPGCVPLGLLDGAHLTRSIQAGETLSWADVEIPPSLALDAALSLARRIPGHAPGV